MTTEIGQDVVQYIDKSVAEAANRLMANFILSQLNCRINNGSSEQNCSAEVVEFNSTTTTTNLTQSFDELLQGAFVHLLRSGGASATIEHALAKSPTFHTVLYETMINPIKRNMNIFFLLVMGIFIFNMASGFALMEIGTVRAKNAANSLWKNVLCGVVTALGFWLFGGAIAIGDDLSHFGGATFWGMKGLPSVSNQQVNSDVMNWFFAFVFCTTTGGIVTGAIAERAQLMCYLVFTFISSSFTYPVGAHWCWHPEGWLHRGQEYIIEGEPVRIGFLDFAGSGVVHACGGTAALVAIIFIGPRIGRFGPKGVVNEIAGHSLTFVGAGAMGLFGGFIAFNAGSELAISSEIDGDRINHAVVNTVLSGVGGVICTALITRVMAGRWLVFPILCGGLAGNVAICGGCAWYEGWAAFCIGALAGITFLVVSAALRALRIDDVVDAVPVHCGGSFIGLISVAFFKIDEGIFYKWDKKSGLILAWQLLGFVAIFLWSALNTYVTFYIMKMFNMVRVDVESELVGLDYAHGHETSYPSSAYSPPNLCSGDGVYFRTNDNNIYEDMLLEEFSKYSVEQIDNPGWSHPIYGNAIYDLSWLSIVTPHRLKKRKRVYKVNSTIAAIFPNYTDIFARNMRNNIEKTASSPNDSTCSGVTTSSI